MSSITQESEDSLVRELQAQLDDVATVKLIPLNRESFFVGALVRKQPSDPSRITRQIIEFGISRKLHLYPAVYREKDWPYFAGNSRKRGSSPASLIEHYKSDGEFPREFRRLLTTTIRNYLACFDWIRSSLEVPRDLALGFSVLLLRESFDLLFATRGQKFTGDNDSVPVFEDSFASTDFFDKEDICLYFRFVGLHYQAQHEYRFSPRGEPSFEWEGPLDEAANFLERFDRYVRETFSTDKEKARRKTVKKIAVAGSLGLVLLGVVLLYIAGQPLSSRVDKRLITKPGGIVGEYFNGKRFDRKVLERVDRRINLNTNRSPAGGIRFDRFSIRWTGYLYIPKTGSSYLCVECDDGARVYLDGDLLINDWTTQPLHKACRKVRMKKGWFPIRVEYYDETRRATIRLLWGRKKKKASLVPAKHLCCMK